MQHNDPQRVFTHLRRWIIFSDKQSISGIEFQLNLSAILEMNMGEGRVAPLHKSNAWGQSQIAIFRPRQKMGKGGIIRRARETNTYSTL